MDTSDSKQSKGGPHSYSTQPFARTNLSSASATSLLHRRGLGGRGSSHIPNIISAMPSISPKHIKPINSPKSLANINDELRKNAKIHPTSNAADISQANTLKSPTTIISNKWNSKSSSDIESSIGILPATIKDENQAKKNDMILQERLMEAKSINPKTSSGATVHKFSLWNGVKNQTAAPSIQVSSPTSSSTTESQNFTNTISKEEVEPILPKTMKPRGPKAAIEMQGQYDMSLLSAKLSSLETVQKTSSTSAASRSMTPQREERQDVSNDVTLSEPEKYQNSEKLFSKSTSSSSRGLTSSLRNKIDNASKVAKSADADLDIGKRADAAKKKSSKESTTAKEKRSKRISAKNDDLAKEEGVKAIENYTDDDFEAECLSLGSVEEEEQSRIQSRPSSEHSLLDDKPAVGRPPLPGIRYQVGDSQDIKHGKQKNRKYGNNNDDKLSAPVVRRSLGSVLPMLELETDISPKHSSIGKVVSPPPLLKQNMLGEEKLLRGKDDSLDFKLSESPTITPKRERGRSEPYEYTPKLAFSSRPPSLNGSIGGDSDHSGNNSGNNSLSQSFKDESFAFGSIKDTPPDSRSHSIFMNPKDFSSTLALTFQNMENESIAVNSRSRSNSNSNNNGIYPSFANEFYSMPMPTASPDYSKETFETASPTLSVMSHMSEPEPADRYEQLVYSRSTNGSPQPKEKLVNPFANPFANPSKNPFSSSSNANTLASPIPSKFKFTNLPESKGIESSAQEKEQVSKQLDFNQVGTFNEDDNHGYSEVVYVGANGDNTLRWKRGQTIGEGTFGRVYKGMNESTGELAAVKQLGIGNGSEADIDVIKREIKVMWQLNHENIVRYLGTSRSSRYLFIVLEYISGGSIASMLQNFGPFSESLIRKFSYHIICGVDYLHNKGIVHRDIKGANVLVTDTGIAKIADFGCSKQLAGLCTTSLEESLKTIRGSVPWMAPEVIKQAGHGRSSDIWSVGATVIEMATGKPPWSEFTNNLAALFHVATSKEPPPIPSHLSRPCAAFLSKCMIVDHTQRATAHELLSKDEFLGSEIGQQKRSRTSSLALAPV